MSFEEELHEEIDNWNMLTVEKMQLEESILNIYKKEQQRVREELKRFLLMIDVSYGDWKELYERLGL